MLIRRLMLCTEAIYDFSDEIVGSWAVKSRVRQLCININTRMLKREDAIG